MARFQVLSLSAALLVKESLACSRSGNISLKFLCWATRVTRELSMSAEGMLLGPFITAWGRQVLLEGTSFRPCSPASLEPCFTLSTSTVRQRSCLLGKGPEVSNQ